MGVCQVTNLYSKEITMQQRNIQVKINDTSNDREWVKPWEDLPVVTNFTLQVDDLCTLTNASQQMLDEFAADYGDCEMRWNETGGDGGHYKEYFAPIGQHPAPIVAGKRDPWAIEIELPE
jgi:hypothetical protein